MKVLGVLVIMALVVGAFTSIPNVSALSENQFGDLVLYKGAGNSQPKYGSATGVCGIELCGSKSMPQIKETKVESITSSGDAKSEALSRALQGQEASVIIREYNDFKGIKIVEVINATEEIASDFNAFANPDFLHSKTKSTLMKTPDTMTIIEKKKIQEEALLANLPAYIKNSYANPDHSVYIQKTSPIVVGNTTSVIEQNSNMSNASADLILFEMGFDIDMSKIGVCGPGTELIDGICFVAQTGKPVNNDWADYWDTKEDKEVVLEQIIMTNGTDALSLVNGTMQVPAPGFEDVEEMVVEPIVEEVKQEIILETMTIVVDGKTFKDQESADRYLALTGKTVAPIKETPITNPRIDTMNNTMSSVQPSNDEATPPPFQVGQ